MADEKCFTCRFWTSGRYRLRKDAFPNDAGFCLRHGPSTPLIIRTRAEMMGADEGVWPQVYGHQWCGDWSLYAPPTAEEK